MSDSFLISAGTSAPRAEPQPLAQNLPATVEPAKPRHVVHRADGTTKVALIAQYDATLAERLWERCDFSNVIQGGAQLTLKDAYQALTTREFARFDAIAQGLKDADAPREHAIIGTTIIGATAVSADAILLGTAGISPGTVLIAFFTGLIGAAVCAGWLESGIKTRRARLEALPEKLASFRLPAPEQAPALPAPKDVA